MADLRNIVADVITDYLDEYMDSEVFHNRNKASKFAYLTINSYLEGPNKDTKLFLDDVRVVLETDPITGLYLIYLVRGEDATPHQKQRVKNLVSYDGFEISMTSDIFDIGTRINDVVDKLQEEVDEWFMNNENFYINSYQDACDFLTSEELEQMRLEFGFNTPVDDNDSDDSSEDDYQSEDQDERIFNDNDWQIRDWIRETKSYDNWADRAWNDIVIDMQNHGRIKDLVLEDINLDSLIEQFEDDYKQFMRDDAMEWEGSDLRIWYNEDELPDFPPDDLAPNIIYSASADSFIRFDNTIKIQRRYDDTGWGVNYFIFEENRFLFIDTDYIYSKDPVSRLARREIGLLTFLNPNAYLKLFVHIDIVNYNTPDRNVKIEKLIKALFDDKEAKGSDAGVVASFFTSLKTPHRLTLQLKSRIFKSTK